jgi:hypothetical protein
MTKTESRNDLQRTMSERVLLHVDGRKLSVSPARHSLADRLAASPKTPSAWKRDDSLRDGAVGRELL